MNSKNRPNFYHPIFASGNKNTLVSRPCDAVDLSLVAREHLDMRLTGGWKIDVDDLMQVVE